MVLAYHVRLWYLWSWDGSHLHGWYKIISCNLHSNFLIVLLAWRWLLVYSETGCMKTNYCTQELSYDWWWIFTLWNLASYTEKNTDWRLLQCLHKSPPLVPSWGRWIQTGPSHPVCVGFILMLPPVDARVFELLFFHQVAPPKRCVPFSSCVHLLYALLISFFFIWYPNNDFEDHKSWRSLLCTFLQSPVTSFLFGWIPSSAPCSWTSSAYFFS